jgi:signal transduction histidine kinase
MERARPARAGNIAGQAQRLGKLVETLLDISRIETGRLELHLETLNLCGMAGRAVENLRPSLRNHTTDLDMPPDPVLVRVDDLRFEQVIANLPANVVKYSPKGGAITVEVGRQDGNAFLRVIDVTSREHGSAFTIWLTPVAATVEQSSLAGLSEA